MDIQKQKLKHMCIKNLLIEGFSVSTFEGIIPKIEKGTMYSIVTKKAINPYTFLLYALKKYKHIEELYIATYRISEKAMQNLKYLIECGAIRKCTLLINDNYKVLLRAAAQTLIKMDEELQQFTLKPKNSHAKITLIKTQTKHIVIQGSGNYSTNPKIEQYTI